MVKDGGPSGSKVHRPSRGDVTSKRVSADPKGTRVYNGTNTATASNATVFKSRTECKEAGPARSQRSPLTSSLYKDLCRSPPRARQGVAIQNAVGAIRGLENRGGLVNLAVLKHLKYFVFDPVCGSRSAALLVDTEHVAPDQNKRSRESCLKSQDLEI